jgi:protein ImuA
MTLRSRDTVLGSLRTRIAALERGGVCTGSESPRVLPLGAAEIDCALPGGGLPLACVHEVAGAAGMGGAGAATGFAVAVLARLGRALEGEGSAAVLWCLRGAGLYGPGLAAFGFDPGRLIVVRARRRRDVLWAMEEGLRCPGLTAVIGEVEGIGIKECRRLQLAAECGGVTGFLLREGAAKAGGASGSVMTSWRIAPSPGPFPGRQGTGILAARWRVDLARCRGGVPGAWLVDWNDETGDFTVAAALRDGPAVPPPGGDRRDGSELAG